MSTSIYNNLLEYNVKYQKVEDDNCFNDVVLAHLRNNKPAGELAQLLHEMRRLSPEVPITMQKLSSALLYSNTTLRSDPDHVNYTNNILDKRASQLLGLNMLINVMLNNLLHHDDEDNN